MKFQDNYGTMKLSDDNFDDSNWKDLLQKGRKNENEDMPDDEELSDAEDLSDAERQDSPNMHKLLKIMMREETSDLPE